MGILHSPDRWKAPSRNGSAEQGPTLPAGGEPPYDGAMEARLKALEAALPTLATKTDVADLRVEFAGLRGDVKAGVADLRADLHKADSAHKTWILATVLAVLGTGVAVVTFLRNPAPASQPAAQQQPIIINVPGAVPAPAAPASTAR